MKKALANMFTFHKRADGTYFGFGTNLEGWFCYIGYMVTVCYVISKICAVAYSISEKLEARKKLKAKRKEELKDITDNGPVENTEEAEDLSKIDAFQDLYKEFCN